MIYDNICIPWKSKQCVNPCKPPNVYHAYKPSIHLDLPESAGRREVNRGELVEKVLPQWTTDEVLSKSRWISAI